MVIALYSWGLLPVGFHDTDNGRLISNESGHIYERFEKLARFLILLFSKIFQKRRSKTYSKKVLNRNKSHNDPKSIKGLFIGEVIQAGIRKDLKIDYVIFKDGNYIDIGTTEDLVKATNES